MGGRGREMRGWGRERRGSKVHTGVLWCFFGESFVCLCGLFGKFGIGSAAWESVDTSGGCRGLFCLYFYFTDADKHTFSLHSCTLNIRVSTDGV